MWVKKKQGRGERDPLPCQSAARRGIEGTPRLRSHLCICGCCRGLGALFAGNSSPTTLRTGYPVPYTTPFSGGTPWWCRSQAGPPVFAPYRGRLTVSILNTGPRGGSRRAAPAVPGLDCAPLCSFPLVLLPQCPFARFTSAPSYTVSVVVPKISGASPRGIPGATVSA